MQPSPLPTPSSPLPAPPRHPQFSTLSTSLPSSPSSVTYSDQNSEEATLTREEHVLDGYEEDDDDSSADEAHEDHDRILRRRQQLERRKSLQGHSMRLVIDTSIRQPPPPPLLLSTSPPPPPPANRNSDITLTTPLASSTLSSSTSSTPKSMPLIRVDTEKIVLNNIVWSTSRRTLHRFHITNTSFNTVHVRLSHSFEDRSVVSFQLNNENAITVGREGSFADTPSTPASMEASTANGKRESTERSRRRNRYGGANIYDMVNGSRYANQLFNAIDLVSKVVLQPHETKLLIIGFLPKMKDPSSLPKPPQLTALSGERNNGEGTENPMLTLDDRTSRTQHHKRYSFYSVEGTIRLYASALPETLSNERDITTIDQTIQVPFIAKLCRTELAVDCRELDFGSCLPNQRNVKDMAVWNRSEIPLHFTISSQQLATENVRFMEYESGKVLTGTQTIAGYSHMRISVTFTPEDIGVTEFQIFVENVANGENSAVVSARANITLGSQEASFEVENEKGSPISVLDMGHCYAGNNGAGVFRILTLRNTSQRSLEMSLSSDDPEHVSFCQHIENYSGESASINADQLTTATNSPNTMPAKDNAIDGKREDNSSTFEHKSPNNPDSPSRNKKVHSSEEFLFLSGEQKRLEVWYSWNEQMRDNERDHTITALSKNQFRLNIKCRDDKDHKFKTLGTKTILCSVKCCTSIVNATPRHINFGDSSIGSVKYATVTVENASDLPTRIAVRFDSKVVTCNIKEANIPPHQNISIKFKLSPRRVNPHYRKQITIVNFNNPENECIIEMESNNIDSNMLIFHSMFYDVHTSSQHNFAKSIEFSTTIVNDPSLRTFMIRNITDKPIKLAITTSSPDELQIFRRGSLREYSVAIKNQLLAPILSEQQFFENAEEKYNSECSPSIRPSKAVVTTANLKSSTSTSTSLTSDSKLEKASRISNSETNTLRELNVHLTSLANMFHTIHEDYPLEMSDESYAIFKKELRRYLELTIEHGLLTSCSVLNLDPREESAIYTMFKPLSLTRASLRGSSKKIEERLFISLLEYDESSIRKQMTSEHIQHPNLKDVPPRELFVQANLYQSAMGITQKFINFGSISNTEEKTKIITVSNLSEISLLYRIKKTGSIASSDLQLDDDMALFGQIRPFGSRTLNLTFKPSIAGKFYETLTIENLRDPEDTKVITIKAYIEKPEKFLLKTSEIDFGEVTLDTRSSVRKLTLVNNTKRRRIYEIRKDMSNHPHCAFDFEYDLVEASVVAETEKLEAELEKHEHKFRIAVRKNKTGKIKKLSERIKEIKKLLGDETNDDDDDDDGLLSSDDELSKRKKRIKLTEHGIRFSVPPNATQIINIAFTPSISEFNPRAVLNLLNKNTHQGTLMVYESKNNDTQKNITLRFKVSEDSILKYGTIAMKPSSENSNTASLENKPQENDSAKLELSTSEIDLGRVSVGEAETCTLTVKNTSHAIQTGFVILTMSSPYPDSSPFSQYTEDSNDERPMKLHFSCKNAMLDPNQVMSITITCTPQSTGPQRHTITLQNLLTKRIHTCTIYCNPQRPPPVYFPQIFGKKQELNVGYSFVDTTRTYACVFEFFVHNVKDEELSFDVRTNSAAQVHIFQDEDRTVPAENVILKAKSRKAICVCLRPNLSITAMDAGQCRVFAAGLHVKVYSSDRSLSLFERTIPFKSVVGHSVLKCSTNVIDFGGTSQVGAEFHGHFKIHNTNMYLPLEYEVELPENMCITLLDIPNSVDDRMHTGRMVGQKIKGASTKQISFVLKTHRHGINNTLIKIRNKSNLEQELHIKVRAFVDSDSIGTDLTESYKGVDVLSMQSVYVCMPQDSRSTERNLSIVVPQTDGINADISNNSYFRSGDNSAIQSQFSFIRSFTLLNKTDNVITLRTISDIDVDIIPFGPNDDPEHSQQTYSERLSSLLKPEHASSDNLILFPHQQLKVVLILRGLPELNDEQLLALQTIKQSEFGGTIHFLQTRKGEEEESVVKIIQLRIHTCISEGVLSTQSVYVGKFGHVSWWRDHNFEFKIRNTTNAPLIITAKPEIREEFHIHGTNNLAEGKGLPPPIFPDDSNNISSSPVIVVEPLRTTTIRAKLIASAFRKCTPGLLQRKIHLMNQNNQANSMTLLIVGELTARIWKVSNLDEEGQAILPMLELPPRPLAPPCDKTFSVINTSKESILSAFEINTDAQVGNFLRLELLDFSSSAPLKEYRFQSSAALDIRVKCVANSSAYIPQKLWDSVSVKHEHGTTPLIRMGQVKMRTSGQPAEIIDIYGSLVQNPTLTVSIKRFFFSMELLDDDMISTPDGDAMHQPKVTTFQHSFNVTNIKSDSLLHFKIEPIVSEHTQYSLTTVPVQGSVEPGGSILISVFLDIARSESAGAHFQEEMERNSTSSWDESDIASIFLKVTDIYAPLVSETIVFRNIQMPPSYGNETFAEEVPSAIMVNSNALSYGHRDNDNETSIHGDSNDSVNAIGSSSQSSLSILPNAQNSRATPALTAQHTLPVLTVKGCTTISKGRYEAHIGQHNLNSEEPVEWDLVIQNINTAPVTYKIHTIEETTWMSLSHSKGTIMSQNDTHHVTLLFSTHELRTFSTYLILENCANPMDVKVIRVQMEVVLGGAQNGRQLFAVHVDGSPDNVHVPTLDLGEVFFGSMVRHRYIDIINLSDYPLEFKLTSALDSVKENNLHSELHFSLSLTSLKSFHTLQVGRNSKCRVYIMYKPYRPKQGKQLRLDFSEMAPLVDETELFIKCRLVKDYQQVVKLVAKCVSPRMKVSTSDLLFVGDKKTKIEPPSSNATIHNLSKDALRYRLRSDYCNFFEIIAPRKSLIAGRSNHTITVRPILSRIFQPEIMQQKYIEEHFTIYNRHNLKEKWWITMRFTRGYLKQFYTAPGPKSAFAFSSLEDNVVRLLREFNVLIHDALAVTSLDGKLVVEEGEVDRRRGMRRNNFSVESFESESSEASVNEESASNSEENARRLVRMFRKQPFTKLYFDLHYITDELVFYGLKGKSVAQTFFDLAQLLYSGLLEHDVFYILLSHEQELLNKTLHSSDDVTSDSARNSLSAVQSVRKQWIGQLYYFLSFFPDESETLLPSLRQLRQKLLDQHGMAS